MNLVTLSGLPEPGTELREDRRLGSGLARFVTPQDRARESRVRWWEWKRNGVGLVPELRPTRAYSHFP